MVPLWEKTPSHMSNVGPNPETLSSPHLLHSLTLSSLDPQLWSLMGPHILFLTILEYRENVAFLLSVMISNFLLTLNVADLN